MSINKIIGVKILAENNMYKIYLRDKLIEQVVNLNYLSAVEKKMAKKLTKT